MNVISTAGVPAGDRFTFWREMSSRLWVPYDLRCQPHWEGRFQARISVIELGPVQASLMTATPYAIERTPRLIGQADPEVFKLACTVRGRGMVAQDGRCAEFGLGDLILRGVGALASQFLLHLARHMHELGPPDAARLCTLTLDVLTAALGAALDAQSAVPSHTGRRALTAQIFAFIRRNLDDPQLPPDAIASAHHISLRYLHKLFQQEGHTVAGWVRERRLERCRRDLADPRLADRPINAIAARWGFTSAAHFSQAFRGAYGLSPRQFRLQCAEAKGVCAP